jgi:hypothetical protein
LLPKTMEDEAQAIQWSFWVMTEVEKPALAVLLHRFFLPEDQRDSKLADEGEQQLQKPLVRPGSWTEAKAQDGSPGNLGDPAHAHPGYKQSNT